MSADVKRTIIDDKNRSCDIENRPIFCRPINRPISNRTVAAVIVLCAQIDDSISSIIIIIIIIIIVYYAKQSNRYYTQNITETLTSGGFETFSLGTNGVAMVLVGGIEPERLQVSYYELHYHRVREIRRQNNNTAQTVNGSKFSESTQNMHANVYIWQNTIFLAAKTGALALSFSNMPAS